MPGRPSSLCTEQMLMILPRRRGIMRRATAWPTRNTLSTLVFISSCQCASSNWSSGARRCMPALLTRMSMAPMSASMRSIGLGHGIARGHVEGGGEDGGAFVAQPRGGLLELVGVARVEDHARAGAGQPARQREADAGAGAGDERGAAAEVEALEDGVQCGVSMQGACVAQYRLAIAHRFALVRRAVRSVGAARLERVDEGAVPAALLHRPHRLRFGRQVRRAPSRSAARPRRARRPAGRPGRRRRCRRG